MRLAKYEVEEETYREVKVDYSRAIGCCRREANRGSLYVLRGMGLKALSNKTENKVVKNILNEIPLTFITINKALKEVLDCIEYIDFWNEVEMYQIKTEKITKV